MKMHRVTAVILAIAISSDIAGAVGSVCCSTIGKNLLSQPANKIRGCDSQGCSGYNDPRSWAGMTGDGLDVVCKDGSVVYAPFTGKTDKQARPYRDSNAIDKVQLSGSGFCIKMFYIKPIKYSSPNKKGEKIGVLLPMQRVYQGITSRVHIQNCDLTGPTPNL
ncbi:LOW QUALITY PROTEIN: leukocyte cell-derived chemotaxin-2 [Theristicus caerulescens]